MTIHTAYLTARKISALRSALKSAAKNTHSDSQREALAEGAECLKGAKPEYIINLIKQDHPLRVECVRLIEKMGLLN